MSELHKLKARKAKLKQLEERSHLRTVPSKVANNRHLVGTVDQGTLAFADMSLEYSERIRGFKTSVSKEDANKLLKSFGNDAEPMEHILEPIFLSLIDGAMRAFKIGTKQGITASRLFSECKSFSYSFPESKALMPDSYTEHLNERENITKYGNTATYNNGNLSRNGAEQKMRDGSKMSAAKTRHFNNKRTAIDGYGGNKEIYESGTHAKGVDKHGQRTEIDHILSCAEICHNLKKNKALTDSDIKDIVNIEDNLVATSFENNRGKHVGKFDKTRTELQKEIDQGYISGSKGNKLHVLSSEELAVRKNMVEKMDKAQAAMDKKTNQIVANNLFESDKSFQERVKREYIEQNSKGKKKGR